MSALKIHINQLGYRIHARKVAVVSGDVAADSRPYLVNASNSTRVELSISKVGMDSYSGECLWEIDFTDIKTKGRYFIEFYNDSRSDSFLIDDRIYDNTLRDLIQVLYFQRCGCGLNKRYAGLYQHGTCHTGSVLRYSDGKLLPPITGGWHDAGDYGRYVTPGAVTVAHLLYLFELYPRKCPALSIPKDNAKEPDILSECRYELDWLMKMQQEDGSVAHKLTTMKHAPFVMPENDLDQLILYPASTMAVADFVAVTALAARIYRSYDAEYADTLLQASLRSEGFLAAHPEFIGFRNPPDNNTGSYADRSDSDERLWAYAELYRLTKEPRYLTELTALIDKVPYKTSLGWGLVSGLAGLSILFAQLDTFPDELCSTFRKAFLENADRFLAHSATNGYRLAMPPEAFGWGSTMTLMDISSTMIIATLLSGKPEYAAAAEEHVHYLLGRNPLDRSYITGHGSHPVRNVHNRPTISDNIEEPFPGLVSGGVNFYPCDDVARAGIPQGTPALCCHVDHVESFSTNEIAIYWNSITAFVMAFFA